MKYLEGVVELENHVLHSIISIVGIQNDCEHAEFEPIPYLPKINIVSLNL